jgi:3-oxoacyl-[acyl-carrier protein] reductase
MASVEDLLRAVAPSRGWGETWEEIERGAVRDFVPAYLASPVAYYVSGATLRVDGGTIRTV